MSNKWPTVRLAEVLNPVSRPTTPDVARSYRLLGVRLDGNGAFHRETVTGAETSASQLFEVTDGDFIYSRLFAWRGAFGLIGGDLAGAYVSSEFPTFRADEQRLDPRFLNYWFRLPDTLRRVEADCTGSTPLTRNRFKETFFLNLEIALPSIGEQRRIVDLIEAIAGKVEEAKRLRGEADAGADDLMIAMAHRRDLPDDVKQARGWVRRKLGECMQLSEEPVKVAVSESYPNLGIYSFGRGLFAKAPIAGFETSASRLFRVKTRQFIYSRLFAFEGAYGVVGEVFDGCFVSNEYPTFDCRPDVVRPEFLAAYFQTPTVWRAVATGSKGLGDRRQRVHPEQVLNHELWVPPLAYQDTLARMSWQRVSSRIPADECSVAMDAVVPAVLDKAFRGEM